MWSCFAVPGPRRAKRPRRSLASQCWSGRGILEALDARDEVAHSCGRPRPAPRERGDIAGGERVGQGSRRCDAARPQFGQDGRQAGSTSVSAVRLGLAPGLARAWIISASGCGTQHPEAREALDHAARLGGRPFRMTARCGHSGQGNVRAGGALRLHVKRGQAPGLRR